MDQHLLYMGQELGNHLILASVGISHGSLLNLVLSLRTGPLSRPLACLPCSAYPLVARQPILQHVINNTATTTTTAATSTDSGTPSLAGAKLPIPILMPVLCISPNIHMMNNDLRQIQSQSSLEPNLNDGPDTDFGSVAAEATATATATTTTTDNGDDEMNQIAEYLGYAIHDSEQIDSVGYQHKLEPDFVHYSDCFHELSESGDSSDFVIEPSSLTRADDHDDDDNDNTDQYDLEHVSLRWIASNSQIAPEESSEMDKILLESVHHNNSSVAVQGQTQEYVNSTCTQTLSISKASSSKSPYPMPKDMEKISLSSSMGTTISGSSDSTSPYDSTNFPVPSTPQTNLCARLNDPRYPTAFILNSSMPIPPDIWRHQPVLLPGGLSSPSSTNKSDSGWYRPVILSSQLPIIPRIPFQASSHVPGSETSQQMVSFPIMYSQWDMNSRLAFLSMWNNAMNHSKPEHISQGPDPSEDKNSCPDPSEPSDQSETLDYSKRPSRCSECNKRTRPACGFSCRCKRWFCSKHHHPEDHKCDFNFKAMPNPMLITVPSQLPP